VGNKTSEQKDADYALEEAIKAAMKAYNVPAPGFFMVDFIVAIELMKMDMTDADGAPHGDVGLLFRQGQVRATVALGLLTQASDILRYRSSEANCTCDPDDDSIE
jgi:hypothetical protein